MNTSTQSSTITNNLNDEIRKISSYILPIAMIFTFIGNIINICVLSRHDLRLSPCSHYFIALAFANLIYMSISPMSIYIYYQFCIIFANSPYTCRIINTIIYSSSLFVILMLVCASLDRFFASSSL
ncbi:hypothetical protein I4U23_005601, partial [Adineta vaga]